MQDIREYEIGGDTFRVSQLGGTRGCKLYARLMRLFAPAVAKALGNVADMNLTALASLNVGSLADAIVMLTERLTEAETESLIKEVLSTAQVKDGEKWIALWPVFDQRMAGRVYDVIKLCIFACEVHCGNFFAALRADIQNLIPKQKSGSPESSISATSGPSGA